MAAPTPVSAYLHSATMVKAGVFLLARLWPVLSGTDAWFWIVGLGRACARCCSAPIFAIFQHDLKGLLAYSTISHLGLITLLLGLGSPLAAVAAIFHMMNHATFKASLFMAAGIIDHETGTRDMRRLSGLFQLMPITATLAMVASAAMAGVPLLNGFLSKEMFFAEAVETHADSLLDTCAALCRARSPSAFAVAYSLRFIHRCSSARRRRTCRASRTSRRSGCGFPIELLVLACLVVGIVPGADHRPVPAYGGGRRCSGDRDAGLQPRGLARLQLAAADERVALVGGVALYCAAAATIARARRGARRCSAGSRASASSSAFWSRCRWSWARCARDACSAPARLQPQLRLLVAAAFARRRSGRCCGAGFELRPPGRRRLRSRASRCSGPSASPAPSARPGRPSTTACRAGPAGRRRAGHLHHLRLVLGARPRAHPARSSRSSPRCCSCSACAGCRSGSEKVDDAVEHRRRGLRRCRDARHRDRLRHPASPRSPTR